MHKSQLVLLTTYTLDTTKVSKMVAVRKPGTKIDMLVIMMPKLKFVTLELDAEIEELRTICMHNFEHDPRLQATGKVSPR